MREGHPSATGSNTMTEMKANEELKAGDSESLGGNHHLHCNTCSNDKPFDSHKNHKH